MPDRTNSDAAGFEIGNSAEALDALIRQSSDCAKVVDLDGRVIKWNNACEEVYGWTASQAVGSVLPHIPDELKLKALRLIRDVCASGIVSEHDIEAVRADGTRVSMRIVWIPLVDSDGDAAGVLTVAHEMLIDGRLDRQREEFNAFIARSLTEPLSTIANAASLLMRSEVVADRERRTRLARTIAERTRALSGLVEDMRLVSHLGEGQMVLDREPVSLNSVVGEVVAAFVDRGARIAVDFDSTMPHCLVDVTRIRRAVNVLVGKALKQAPEGSMVMVSVFERQRFAVIEVRDQGSMVDPGDVEHIFDRHYAGAEPRGAEDAGTGLYLVRAIAEAHGGRVAITVGNGVAFTVMLPLPTGGA